MNMSVGGAGGGYDAGNGGVYMDAIIHSIKAS